MDASPDTAHFTTPARSIQPPAGGEPYLLTPGPLTTAASVKQAMQKDWGSWDAEFRHLTARMRERILAIIGEPSQNGEFTCVPLQGSGTYIVEAMLGSLIPRDGKVLVLVNGAYGQRMVQTLDYLGRRYTTIDKGDYLPPRGHEVTRALKADPQISHVVVVHCETSSGILNPIEEIGAAVAGQKRRLLVDSMSAFGALPLDPHKMPIDAMVSSANKCLEGVPGFGFAVVRKSALLNAAGNCHSLSLDLHAQWQHLERTGQWRFTPPTHTIAAFHQALDLFDLEGGAPGRLARYQTNCATLVAGFRALGFQTLLDEQWLSPIIVTFFNPADPRFSFSSFYELMKKQGFIIYPGKLTAVESFRVGCIGQLDSAIMADVTIAAGKALKEMGVSDASPPATTLQQRSAITQ